MPHWFWWLAVALQGVAFATFALDKAFARLQRRRIPERTLLWLTWLGCIGAWCAMGLCRHKTSKTSFRWRAVLLTVLSPLWLALWWQLR